MGLTTKRKLNMETVAVRGDLFEALKSLSDIDGEFNGRKGDKFLSEEAEAAGFKTNQDYLLHKIRELFKSGEYDTIDEAVNAFCEGWLDNNSNYEEWEVVCHFSSCCIDFIVLAYVTR